MSIPTEAESVTSLDLLMDAVGYGTVVGLAQVVSHKIFAKKQLPETWEELLTRYVAGSSIVAGALTAYALHRPQASGRDVAAMLWLVFGAAGIVVAGCHYFDYHLAEAAREEGRKLGADALRRQYQEEERGEFPPAVIRRGTH